MSNRRLAPGPGTSDEVRELIRELNGVRKDLAAERKAAETVLTELKRCLSEVPGQIDELIAEFVKEKSQGVRDYITEQTELTQKFILAMHAAFQDQANAQVSEVCDRQVQMLSEASDMVTFARSIEKTLEISLIERFSKSLNEQLDGIKKDIMLALRRKWNG